MFGVVFTVKWRKQKVCFERKKYTAVNIIFNAGQQKRVTQSRHVKIKFVRLILPRWPNRNDSMWRSVSSLGRGKPVALPFRSSRTRSGTVALVCVWRHRPTNQFPGSSLRWLSRPSPWFDRCRCVLQVKRWKEISYHIASTF